MERDFAGVFEGRLAALGRVDRLASPQGVSLTRLLDEELTAFAREPGRYSLSGPHLVLHLDCTFALSLLVHELAANAEQHGSLSVPGGRVDVVWQIVDGDLMLTWSESGGPPVRRPPSPQFGNLLVAYAAAKLNGSAMQLYCQSGLVCDLRISLRARWPRRRSALRLGASEGMPSRAF